MTLSTRKRKRKESIDEEILEISPSRLLTDEQRREKALELWHSFREEYYEAAEQLPLSLHRTFSLMSELDGQAQRYQSALLRLIRHYTEQRSSIAAQSVHHTPEKTHPEDGGSLKSAPRSATPDLSSHFPFSDTKSIPTTPRRSVSRPSESDRVESELLKAPDSTRETISQIARLLDETVRASDEKVNLAQAAYDSADRHVRLLDQAIKEQEANLSIGLRPGTRAAPIVLSGLHAQGLPITSTSIPRDDENPFLVLRAANDADRNPTRTTTRGDSRRGTTQHGNAQPIDTGVTAEPASPQRRGRRNPPTPTTRLKLTLPPSASLIFSQAEMPIDPHEPRYCFCNEVSYGQMVGCDGDCEREWYHYRCVGLTEAPKNKWYCKDCKEKMNKAASRKR
ncbi:hypothetical protein BD410DRAFT_832518 [Rickenella mellea]|uniref:Chromatin modification-related protein n=1 Tax=Rickenella mellea TaxID=50990 RepID=A0A4Y7PJM3_9AGAM|nr:hypothetical protein BD410DRAFT_832518 [Rickenella mellea]